MSNIPPYSSSLFGGLSLARLYTIFATISSVPAKISAALTAGSLNSKNNTLDDGSGNMTLAGNLNFSGSQSELISFGSGGIYLDQYGNFVFKSAATTGNNWTLQSNSTGGSVSPLQIFNANNAKFVVARSATNAVQMTDSVGGNLFNVSSAGLITTKSGSVLDDGSGNVTISGVLTTSTNGIVSQATSVTTAVTSNTQKTSISLFATAYGATSVSEFKFNNTVITNNSNILTSISINGSAPGVALGSISVYNRTGTAGYCYIGIVNSAGAGVSIAGLTVNVVVL